jgi:hypothetical protein
LGSGVLKSALTDGPLTSEMCSAVRSIQIATVSPLGVGLIGPGAMSRGFRLADQRRASGSNPFEVTRQ